jgi:hypothetical protein
MILWWWLWENVLHQYWRICRLTRDNILIVKPTRCTDFLKFYFEMKLYMFRTVPLSIIRSFSLYTQQWYMSYRFVDSFWAAAGSGWNILILLDSCLQTCMTYTIAVCTVRNSWWWTEELSKTCSFISKIKFEKISAFGWFYYKDLSRCMVTWT